MARDTDQTNRWKAVKCQISTMCVPVGLFVGCYSASGLMTSTLAVYVNSQISTLERQFGLSSTESGMLMSANEIGFLLLTLFTGYIAPRIHIPRVLAISTILFGVSALTCTLPYVITRVIDPKPETSIEFQQNAVINKTFDQQKYKLSQLLCQNNSAGKEDVCSNGNTFIPNEYPALRGSTMAIIFMGMIIQGLAKAPRAPLVSYYVDENGPYQRTGWYLGIVTSVSYFGPFLSFGLGGVFSRLYVTLEEVSLSPRDPRWIGAWWLGFLVFGSMSIIVGLPLFLFPRYMKRNRKKNDFRKKSEELRYDQASIIKELKEMLKALWRVVKNPLYSLLMASNIAQLLAVASYLAFLAKYMEYQFSIPVWHANFILAICMISSLCLGTFLGGVVTRRVENSPRKLMKIVLILALLATIAFGFGFFFGCDSIEISGPGIKGYKNTVAVGNCSSACKCDAESYFPSCAPDGTTYFSPCYAGCSTTTGKIFQNCTCIYTPEQTVTAGTCQTDCAYLYPFAVSNFLCSMFGAMKIVPVMIAKMRLVRKRDKALAISVSSFTMSIFGWLPGPLLVGGLIDSSCILWKRDCGHRGACSLYNLNNFRSYVHAFPMAMHILMALIVAIAYFKMRKMHQWIPTDEGDTSVHGNEINSQTMEHETILRSEIS